jgi:hypothetical protein
MLEKVGGLTESHVVSVNYSKVTRTFGQITPKDIDTITVEHRLDEEAIVLGSHSGCPHSAREQMLHPLLIITESRASWGHQIHLRKRKGLFPEEKGTPSEDQVPF